MEDIRGITFKQYQRMCRMHQIARKQQEVCPLSEFGDKCGREACIDWNSLPKAQLKNQQGDGT